MIITIGPMPVDPNEPAPTKDFGELQDCMDRNTWIGRGCTDRLPGGGNTPKEHDENA